MLAHKLEGTANQMVLIQLEPGQTVYADAGKFVWKTTNVAIETRMSQPAGGGSGGGGGFLAAAMQVGKRMLAGETIAFQYFTANGRGVVALAGVLPGEVRALELDGSVGWYTEHQSFVAAESSVDFDIAFTGLRTGMRGHQGFVLEHHTGVGTMFIGAAGNFKEIDLSRFGGKIQVETGSIVAFEDTVRYGIERVGALNAQTAMTALFGGEGLNLATLEGNGRVIVQSTTINSLAKALERHMEPHDEKRGGALGNILSGNI